MLIVVANIKGDKVEDTIIAVGLLHCSLFEDVVFRNEMAGHGMQSTTDDGAESKIGKRFETPKVKDKNVRDDARGPIDELPKTWILWLHEKGPEHIEERLTHDPHSFEERIVE